MKLIRGQNLGTDMRNSPIRESLHAKRELHSTVKLAEEKIETERMQSPPDCIIILIASVS